MKNIIRIGDTLRPYGGQVLSGHYLAFGKPVACIGDSARCNKHGNTTIIEGASGSSMDGKAVALDGHHCACGCTLVSSLSTMDIKP
ncbi:MAG: PAAR domain-containing protein [Providencia heimbachae]|nr:PAAR domain-containing protein [Providencia heimbachae]